MKITNNPNINKIIKAYDNLKTKAPEKPAATDLPKDKLELSSNARDFNLALTAFKNLPEIREDKVKEIKEQLQQGKYNVSAQEIAEKIIEGIRIDKRI